MAWWSLMMVVVETLGSRCSCDWSLTHKTPQLKLLFFFPAGALKRGGCSRVSQHDIPLFLICLWFKRCGWSVSDRPIEDISTRSSLCCVSCPVVEVLSECCLLSYMARVENRLSFLFRLINIINVQTLTQVRFRFYSVTWSHRTQISQALFSCYVNYSRALFVGPCILWQTSLTPPPVSSLFPLLPTGECELFKHQFGDLDVGQKKGQTALLPQCPAGEGVRGEVPRLPAQQLPQLTALLAAPLPQQGQRQHLPGERE